MSERAGVRIVLMVLSGLVIVGCRGSKSAPVDELAAVRQPDAVKPTVGGARQELIVRQPREAILKGVQQAFEETGVNLSVMSEPGGGTWLLGKSLAGRQVLVEVVPVVPERFMVRVTVEGADTLARALLEEVGRAIAGRIG